MCTKGVGENVYRQYVSEYQPSDTPFEKETQYQKDFRAWPIPKRGDHPWIPKPGPSPVLALDRAPPEKAAQEKRRKVQLAPEKKEEHAEAEDEHPKAARPGDGRDKGRKKAEEAGGQPAEPSRGRAAADAVNRQIKEEVAAGVSSSYRNEFRPWIDVKPVKAIKAKNQYKPPEEKMTHETSYSAQFKGETSKPSPADNKYLERRRIRTLYSEPYKEPPKVEKPSIKPSKPKKTTTSHKPLKKAKDKQIASGRAAKKKSAETSNTAKPEDKEKSKERDCRMSISVRTKRDCRVEKPSIKPSKPKKTTTSHKPLKKAKDKQIASGRAAKKKSAETSNTAKPEDKEKSKEMNNKLAEAKE
ncbi:PREDICTED: microtubule-associated protein 6 [Ficedula albicollis]|uniref:microtubule-associated protein 6 n=1 Tax=Ficedula albicollis TaxID=59894 RepID=UPI0007AD7BAF|nr:PREDICTED: microtubule-associated protein 6 [Ficedula albicollis]